MTLEEYLNSEEGKEERRLAEEEGERPFEMGELMDKMETGAAKPTSKD